MKKVAADLLFLMQIGFAVIFGGSQFVEMLTSTEGVSASWFGAWEIFLLLNLWLAWHAHKAQPSRITSQTLWSYGIWAVMITLNLVSVILRDSWSWNERDTITSVAVGTCVAITLVLASSTGQTIKDPLVKGWLAVWFKTIPQLILAWNILLVGGDGLSLVAICAGHATILSRLGQLVLSVREAGWDNNRRGSLLSEIPNGISWAIVTVVWVGV
jgi:hypothetical protein